MSKNIKLVSFDDWELLFIDDKLVWQHHTLQLNELNDFLNLGIEFLNYNMTGLENYLNDVGQVEPNLTWSEFLKLAEDKSDYESKW